jgi:membrane protease subunit HflK
LDDNVIILGKSANAWKRDLQRTFRLGSLAAFILIVLFFIIAGRPFCIVGRTELGVVLRFGQHARTLLPGPHLKWPWPIEAVIPVETQIKRATIGTSAGEPRDYRRSGNRPTEQGESLMLTGDENIIMAEMSVQFRVKDPVAYLFNVDKPDETLEDICEASLRRAIGDYGVDAPLTGGKAEIEEDIQEQAQRVANSYGLGLMLTSINLQDVQAPRDVQPSFKSVVTAKENKQKYINESLGYQNGEIPKAEGRAAGVINEASGYGSERVLRAQGEISRFSALLFEYRKAPEVTKTRLYLETLEAVLQRVDTTVIDKDVGILPLLDLVGDRKETLQRLNSQLGSGETTEQVEPQP